MSNSGVRDGGGCLGNGSAQRDVGGTVMLRSLKQSPETTGGARGAATHLQKSRGARWKRARAWKDQLEGAAAQPPSRLGVGPLRCHLLPPRGVNSAAEDAVPWPPPLLRGSL